MHYATVYRDQDNNQLYVQVLDAEKNEVRNVYKIETGKKLQEISEKTKLDDFDWVGSSSIYDETEKLSKLIQEVLDNEQKFKESLPKTKIKQATAENIQSVADTDEGVKEAKKALVAAKQEVKTQESAYKKLSDECREARRKLKPEETKLQKLKEKLEGLETQIKESNQNLVEPNARKRQNYRTLNNAYEAIQHKLVNELPDTLELLQDKMDKYKNSEVEVGELEEDHADIQQKRKSCKSEVNKQDIKIKTLRDTENTNMDDKSSKVIQAEKNLKILKDKQATAEKTLAQQYKNVSNTMEDSYAKRELEGTINFYKASAKVTESKAKELEEKTKIRERLNENQKGLLLPEKEILENLLDEPSEELVKFEEIRPVETLIGDKEVKDIQANSKQVIAAHQSALKAKEKTEAVEKKRTKLQLADKQDANQAEITKLTKEFASSADEAIKALKKADADILELPTDGMNTAVRQVKNLRNSAVESLKASVESIGNNAKKDEIAACQNISTNSEKAVNFIKELRFAEAGEAANVASDQLDLATEKFKQAQIAGQTIEKVQNILMLIIEALDLEDSISVDHSGEIDENVSESETDITTLEFALNIAAGITEDAQKAAFGELRFYLNGAVEIVPHQIEGKNNDDKQGFYIGKAVSVDKDMFAISTIADLDVKVEYGDNIYEKIDYKLDAKGNPVSFIEIPHIQGKNEMEGENFTFRIKAEGDNYHKSFDFAEGFARRSKELAKMQAGVPEVENNLKIAKAEVEAQDKIYQKARVDFRNAYKELKKQEGGELSGLAKDYNNEMKNYESAMDEYIQINNELVELQTDLKTAYDGFNNAGANDIKQKLDYLQRQIDEVEAKQKKLEKVKQKYENFGQKVDQLKDQINKKILIVNNVRQVADEASGKVRTEESTLLNLKNKVVQLEDNVIAQLGEAKEVAGNNSKAITALDEEILSHRVDKAAEYEEWLKLGHKNLVRPQRLNSTQKDKINSLVGESDQKYITTNAAYLNRNKVVDETIITQKQVTAIKQNGILLQAAHENATKAAELAEQANAKAVEIQEKLVLLDIQNNPDQTDITELTRQFAVLVEKTAEAAHAAIQAADEAGDYQIAIDAKESAGNTLLGVYNLALNLANDAVNISDGKMQELGQVLEVVQNPDIDNPPLTVINEANKANKAGYIAKAKLEQQEMLYGAILKTLKGDENNLRDQYNEFLRETNTSKTIVDSRISQINAIKENATTGQLRLYPDDSVVFIPTVQLRGAPIKALLVGTRENVSESSFGLAATTGLDVKIQYLSNPVLLESFDVSAGNFINVPVGESEKYQFKGKDDQDFKLTADTAKVKLFLDYQKAEILYQQAGGRLGDAYKTIVQNIQYSSGTQEQLTQATNNFNLRVTFAAKEVTEALSVIPASDKYGYSREAVENLRGNLNQVKNTIINDVQLVEESILNQAQAAIQQVRDMSIGDPRRSQLAKAANEKIAQLKIAEDARQKVQQTLSMPVTESASVRLERDLKNVTTGKTRIYRDGAIVFVSNDSVLAVNPLRVGNVDDVIRGHVSEEGKAYLDLAVTYNNLSYNGDFPVNPEYSLDAHQDEYLELDNEVSTNKFLPGNKDSYNISGDTPKMTSFYQARGEILRLKKLNDTEISVKGNKWVQEYNKINSVLSRIESRIESETHDSDISGDEDSDDIEVLESEKTLLMKINKAIERAQEILNRQLIINRRFMIYHRNQYANAKALPETFIQLQEEYKKLQKEYDAINSLYDLYNNASGVPDTAQLAQLNTGLDKLAVAREAEETKKEGIRDQGDQLRANHRNQSGALYLCSNGNVLFEPEDDDDEENKKIILGRGWYEKIGNEYILKITYGEQVESLDSSTYKVKIPVVDLNTSYSYLELGDTLSPALESFFKAHKEHYHASVSRISETVKSTIPADVKIDLKSNGWKVIREPDFDLGRENYTVEKNGRLLEYNIQSDGEKTTETYSSPYDKTGNSLVDVFDKVDETKYKIIFYHEDQNKAKDLAEKYRAKHPGVQVGYTHDKEDQRSGKGTMLQQEAAVHHLPNRLRS